MAKKKKRRSRQERQNAALKAQRKGLGESFVEARARHHCGHRDWPIVILRAVIDAETKKRDGKIPLSIRAAIAGSRVSGYDAAYAELLRQGKIGDSQEVKAALIRRINERLSEPNPAVALRKFQADCERAVLAGDAAWFKQQANAIQFNDKRSPSEKANAGFEIAVMREYEEAADVPLQNLPQHILKRLEQRKDGRYMIVEGRRFPIREKSLSDDDKKKPWPPRSWRSLCREAIKRIIMRYRRQYASGEEKEQLRRQEQERLKTV